MLLNGTWPVYARRALWVACAAVVSVQAVFVALNLWDRRGPWNLEAEYGYPALVDTALLGLDAVLCFAAYVLACRRRGVVRFPVQWPAVGVLMAWLFVDGGWAMHERITPNAQPLFDRFDLTAPPWLWVVPYLPLMAFGALGILDVARRHLAHDPVARAGAVLGLACWGGAVVMEPVGLELWQLVDPFRYTLALAVEESLEVLGATCFLLAFGRHVLYLAGPVAAAMGAAPVRVPVGAAVQRGDPDAGDGALVYHEGTMTEEGGTPWLD